MNLFSKTPVGSDVHEYQAQEGEMMVKVNEI